MPDLKPEGGFFDFCISPFIKILFWLLLITGVILYIGSIWWLFTLSYIYPYTSMLFSGTLTAHFSFMILLLWMPGSNFLIYFQVKQIWITVVFLVGCLISISLSSTTILLLEPYTKVNFTREEYIAETSARLKNDKESLPNWIRPIDEYECCSWYGPYDFGTIYENTGYTESFSKSFNEICFKNPLNPGETPESKYRIPFDGCGNQIKKNVKLHCERLYISSITAIIFGLLTIIIYLYYYLKLMISKETETDEDTTEMMPIEEEQGNLPIAKKE